MMYISNTFFIKKKKEAYKSKTNEWKNINKLMRVKYKAQSAIQKIPNDVIQKGENVNKSIELSGKLRKVLGRCLALFHSHL